jgi:hypothetical protein
VACMEEGKCLQGFGSEARRDETIGRPRRRWEDNIKIGS